ncbi:peroxiredoxin-like family protein [Salinisphaera orenii]|uniref:peroxiredoxin-like family protein n=1 Tax=Salinisphaera orenii TaxID=856731 RepID=UPI0019550B21
MPELDVPRVNGPQWNLRGQKPEHFTLIVFYRGLHCPICKGYLGDLDNRVEDFRAKGVEPIAISSDTRERAAQTVEEWGLDALPLGYGLSLDSAREWGLFISSAIESKEPDRFAEPGLFLVRPDATLYAASIQTMPFARPSFKELASALDFVIEKDYPARGEV